MPRGRQLSPQLRARICELHSIRYTATQIRTIHPEIPIKTIRSVIRQFATRSDCLTLPRSGRPRILTEEQRDHIYDTVNHTNPHITTRDLLREVDNVVKKRTVQKLCRELGKRKWQQKQRPFITVRHAQERLQWAIEHQAYTLLDWKKVTWSDECTVERGVGIKPTWTFTRPKDQVRLGDVKPVRCSGKGVKKMLWAAFGHDRRTGLVPLDGDPNSAKGGVTSFVIRDLYTYFLPEIMVEGGEFMHDGASVHTARIIRTLLAEMQIRVMKWPAFSPDLNPIENLWALMKAEIYRLHPELEHAPDTDDTLEQLIRAAKQAWHNIDNGILYRLATDMPNRVQAVIDAEGWYTKY